MDTVETDTLYSNGITFLPVLNTVVAFGTLFYTFSVQTAHSVVLHVYSLCSQCIDQTMDYCNSAHGHMVVTAQCHMFTIAAFIELSHKLTFNRA